MARGRHKTKRKRGANQKANAQTHHAKHRFLERYDLDFSNDLQEELLGLVQGRLGSNAVIKYCTKQSCRVTDFVIEREGKFIRFLYDKQRKTIVSALPLGDYERLLVKVPVPPIPPKVRTDTVWTEDEAESYINKVTKKRTIELDAQERIMTAKQITEDEDAYNELLGKYNELKDNSIDFSIFHCYFKAINKIDDYFEYRHDSEKDKTVVMGHIDALKENLEKINNE